MVSRASKCSSLLACTLCWHLLAPTSLALVGLCYPVCAISMQLRPCVNQADNANASSAWSSTWPSTEQHSLSLCWFNQHVHVVQLRWLWSFGLVKSLLKNRLSWSHQPLAFRDGWWYQNGWMFGKVPKGVGAVIFNPKIYIADFPPLNRPFWA